MPLKVGFEGDDCYNHYTKIFQDGNYLIEKEDVGRDYRYHFYYKSGYWWVDEPLRNIPSYVLDRLNDGVRNQILKERI